MAWLTVALLAGCAGSPLQDARHSADAIAASGGLSPVYEAAGPFRLLTYARGLQIPGGPVSVYVEGDGRAWRGGHPPRDPTPPRPMGLRLAALDPSPSVLWIGRPCMYLGDPDAAAACGVRWWTSDRYAAEVVDALLTVLRRRVAPGRPVVLIGHSGGGALATLLAARIQRLPDIHVDALLTVAAPLDLSEWTTSLQITPLSGSLNPITVAGRLAAVPQRHLAGQRDEIVPVAVVRRFVDAIPRPNRARLEVFPEQAHACCWADSWPVLRGTMPPPQITPGN